MHLSTIATAGLMSLAMLMPADSNAQRGGLETYKARGTEPFWSLTIDQRTMRLETPDGRPVVVAAPRPIHGFAGETYRTRTMTVNIVHKQCSDGMSDRRYPDTVTVNLGRRTYNGCGGDPIVANPGAGPIAGDWRILQISGRQVIGNNVTIRFTADRVNGNTGCNSFSGAYRFDRGALVTGPMAVTKRGCMGPVGQQERTMLDILGRRLTVTNNRNGSVLLSAPGGRTLLIQRERDGGPWRR
ncbi:META domain-containing protein [Sphingomonas canadensis]|uniref:META domain-containing protein n=1 Tax=Sphingomonas canadensis TaxID=1219257 RepID=A0ABW3H6S2_9SPHN|nr:META domain-containing protein [Sphingomonas canadensis]MCW3836723.1 META domain-containing protein [Sphingomonas canadensis]